MSETGRAGEPQRVRPVEKQDLAPLAAVLVDAFYEDPVTVYLFPSEASRRRRLARYFGFQLRRVGEVGGLIYTTDDLAGVSLWLPPKRRPPTLSSALGQLFGVLFILGAQTGRAVALADQLERVRPKEAHYYLAGIGVAPARQATGVGSLLLRPVLGQADEECVPVYLESSRQENIGFYRRHGFEVTGEVGRVRGGSPPLWCMRRQPVPPAS